MPRYDKNPLNRYQIIDMKTKEIVMTYNKRNNAMNKAEELDCAAKDYRYLVKKITLTTTGEATV